MIKELKAYEESPSGYKNPENLIQDKINELVETVNELVLCEQMKTCYKLIKEPYEKQKKWIEKLCRFWDDDAFITSKDWAFGMLTSIDKGMQYQYCCNENCNFKHCEPVKPDDDIIYKGGDNGL